ncbi:DEAD/DEAH box DNA helicase [Mucor ambiguus]|uniref:DEAD/DEAH box DNA helicase n=1 Tax=Mucor ambiguus TaxID=91626 RepID=A0A0C9M4N7_9FUNG|nr:DEAD/DEAH box DNA helicase [Mucor ambiguus]
MDAIKLRDYQDRCIKDTLANIKKGNYQQLISLPTGKFDRLQYTSVVMSNLIPLIPSPTAKATKVLVIAHRIELINQAKDQISKFNPKLTVDIEQGSNHCDPTSTDVVVASVQSLNSKDKKDKSKLRMVKFNPKEFKAVIVDEAHHGIAKTYMRIFEHFGVLEGASKVLLWGCTATPNRADCKPLDPVFGPVSFHLGLLEMIDIGHLSDLRITTVDTDECLDDDTLHRVVIASWRQFAEQKKRKSALVFARNIEKTQDLCNGFIADGVNARFITSKTDAKTRASILEDFKSGKIPVLVNCAILTEGTDLPRVDCILLARKTNSEPLFQQMLGRGSRLHEEKQDCLVVDLKKNFERLFDGMMSSQDELDETVNKKVVSKISAKNVGKTGPGDDKYEDSLVTIKHYKSLQDMIEKRRLEKEAKQLLAKALAAEARKSKHAAAAPNLVLKPSLSHKIHKHLNDINMTVRSFTVPSA